MSSVLAGSAGTSNLADQFYQFALTANQRGYDLVRDQFFDHLREQPLHIHHADIMEIVRRLDAIEIKLVAKRICKYECYSLYRYVAAFIISNKVHGLVVNFEIYKHAMKLIQVRKYTDLKAHINHKNLDVNLSLKKYGATIFKFACDIRAVRIRQNLPRRNKDNCALQIAFEAGANINTQPHLRAFWQNNLFLDPDLLHEALDHGLNVNAPLINLVSWETTPIAALAVIHFPLGNKRNPNFKNRIYALCLLIFRGLHISNERKELIKANALVQREWPALFEPGCFWDTCVQEKEKAYKTDFQNFHNAVTGTPEVSMHTVSTDRVFYSNVEVIKLVWEYAVDISRVQNIYLSNLALIDSDLILDPINENKEITLDTLTRYATYLIHTQAQKEYERLRCAFFVMLRQSGFTHIRAIDVEMVMRQFHRVDCSYGLSKKIAYHNLCDLILNLPQWVLLSSDAKQRQAVVKTISDRDIDQLTTILTSEDPPELNTFAGSSFDTDFNVVMHAIQFRMVEHDLSKQPLLDDMIRLLFRHGSCIKNVEYGAEIAFEPVLMNLLLQHGATIPHIPIADLDLPSEVYPDLDETQRVTRYVQSISLTVFHGVPLHLDSLPKERDERPTMAMLYRVLPLLQSTLEESHNGYVGRFEHELTLVSQSMDKSIDHGWCLIFSPSGGIARIIKAFCNDIFFHRRFYREEYDKKVQVLIDESPVSPPAAGP